MNMSFPPPPSEVHFIHNHPSDQTEPNPLGEIEHPCTLGNLNGVLCCKSTPTLGNWTCYSLLVSEQWTILYLNYSVSPICFSARHCKRVLSSVFFFFLFRKLHVLLCYSWCYPVFSWNGQEIVQRENVLHTSHEIWEKYSSYPSPAAAGHCMRRLFSTLVY